MDSPLYIDAISGEKERLKALRLSALRGLPDDILNAIEVLKGCGIISREYDPKIHRLAWRKLPDSVLRAYPSNSEDDEEEMEPNTGKNAKAEEL